MLDSLHLVSAAMAACALGLVLCGYWKRHSLTQGQFVPWGLVVIGLVFLAWRLPAMYREPGWQDEDCYAIPGLTILQTGLPKLPHLPSRNVESVYYRADEVIYMEPPLYFYFQAAFYALLPWEYGTARLSAAAAGVLLLCLCGRLAWRCGGGSKAVLWGMGLFMLSRWFYFPAISARPDILCSAFGVMAILATLSWIQTRKWRWLIASGIAIGLGGLTHPFALAYAVQMAAWVFLSGRGRERVLAPVMLAAVALVTASLWLVLIAQQPEIFEIQFRNQYLHSRGGSLWARLFWPWESFAFHAGFLWPHMRWWQFLLPFAGAILCITFGRAEGRPWLTSIGWLAISGAGLICAFVGAHHPVFGYFSYPAVLGFIGIGWGIDRAMTAMASWPRYSRLARLALGMALVISLLLGSRIRMNLAYFRERDNINFNAPRFARNLIDRLPPDAVYVVDEEFVLDFVVAGRNVLAQRAIAENVVPQGTPYDYRIASRSTDRYFADFPWDDELVEVIGDPEDPYACYAYIYRRSP